MKKIVFEDGMYRVVFDSEREDVVAEEHSGLDAMGAIIWMDTDSPHNEAQALRKALIHALLSRP